LRTLFAELPSLMKSRPRIAWGTGIGLFVVVAFGAWHLYHSSTAVPTNPPAAKTIKQPRALHKLQGDRAPTKTRAVKIEELENLARDAYKQSRYVLPVEASVLAYSKRALALDPSDNYSRMMLGNSIDRGKSQVHQAVKRKDFAQAHRVANAMDQLLPGRKDIAELKQGIRSAERAAAAPNHQKAVPKQEAAAHQKAVPRQKPVPKVSFTAYHLHSDKAPGDHGSYCLGILTASGHHLRFSGRSASPGQKVHKLDFACSDIREIKKNAHVGSRQGGFHIRTVSATTIFVPRDSSLTHISALASACSK
jgi:hypothetical protein